MELFEALVAVCAPIIAVAIHLAITPSGDTRILPASATTNTTHPASFIVECVCIKDSNSLDCVCKYKVFKSFQASLLHCVEM